MVGFELSAYSPIGEIKSIYSLLLKTYSVIVLFYRCLNLILELSFADDLYVTEGKSHIL